MRNESRNRFLIAAEILHAVLVSRPIGAELFRKIKENCPRINFFARDFQ